MSSPLCDFIPSPLGLVRILGTEAAVQHLFLNEDTLPEGATRKPNFGGFADRLRAYFEGDLTALDAIPVDPPGTPFQLEVWRELRTIGPGETISYGELAKRVHRPNASRAVGLANARNPVALIVPCHRVIGSNGDLTGYAGGLEAKRWLLCHEGALLL